MREQEALALMEEKTGIKKDLLLFIAELHLENVILNPMLPETVRKIGRVLDLRPGGNVLDLGCGKGGLSLPLVNVYKVNVVGLDLMPGFIRQAWSRAEYSGFYELCRFAVDDAAEFVTRTQKKWDAVLAVGVMGIIWPDLATGLRDIKPIMAPGGRLVIGVPYQLPEGERKPDMPYELKDEISKQMAAAGEVLEVFDDGREGWDAYLEPQKKMRDELLKKHGDQPAAAGFINHWVAGIEWERENLGFAIWVIRVNE